MPCLPQQCRDAFWPTSTSHYQCPAVKELRSTVRRNDATAADKALARAYLADIASFKDITGNANSFNEILGRMDEFEELGGEFVEAFHFLSSVLECIGNGNYRKGSLWYEITASKSVNTLYQNCTTKLSTSCLCESPRSQASTISTPSLFRSSICPP